MTLVTSLQTVALLMGEMIQNVRLRYFFRGHVIICGIGRKGTLLADQFRTNGDRVVLIERNDNNDSARRFHEEGVLVLTGQAEDRSLFRKARVERAKQIVCVCPDDEINTQICMRSWELINNKRRKPLSCLVHLVSPDLCELLRLEMVKKDPTDQFRVEFFSIFQMGAFSLLNQYPPFKQNGIEANKVQHVIIVSLGRFGQHVLLRIAKEWKTHNSLSGTRFRLTVVDKDAERKTRAMSIVYPKLETVCDIIPRTYEIQSAMFEQGDFLSDDQGCLDLTCIYVCMSNQSLGLQAAFSIHQQLRGATVPVVVCMSDSRGLSALLTRRARTDVPFSSVLPFNLMENTCDIRLVHGVTTEILAQAIHNNYLEGLRAAQADLGDKPAAIPWDELSEFLKEFNRGQADHVGLKLDAVG